MHFKYMLCMIPLLFNLNYFYLGENNMASLYERLGGDAAVNAAVDIFYRKVLSDDRVNDFFDGVDMDAQITK